MKGGGCQIDHPPGKTTLKKPSLIRVKTHSFWYIYLLLVVEKEIRMAAESIFVEFKFLDEFWVCWSENSHPAPDEGSLIECYKILMKLLMNTLTRTFRESWSCKYRLWLVRCLFDVGFDSVFWKYILIFEEFGDFLFASDCISCLTCQYGWRGFPCA